MEHPDQLKGWRRATRLGLRARRMALSACEQRHFSARIRVHIEQTFPCLPGSLMGFYWPFRGEIDLCDFVAGLVDRGARAALPVVVIRGAPLEFWSWRPGDKLTPGVWRIPIPVQRHVVRPEVLLVPLLGFDSKGYRLGNGGGYYDRTLATMAPPPLKIGVGYQCGRLETIYPCSHDVPMDAIVTETGVTWHREQVCR